MDWLVKAKRDLESYKSIRKLAGKDSSEILWDSFYVPVNQQEIYRRCTEEYLPDALKKIYELESKIAHLSSGILNMEEVSDVKDLESDSIPTLAG